MAPLISSLLLLIAAARPAVAADSCENNFKAEGSERDGLRFSTTQTYPSLDVHSSLAQMQKIVKDNGFEACTITGDGTRGSLAVLYKTTRKSRALVMQAGADKASNTLSMTTHLPPGMQAEPQVIRQVMCGMLGKVKPGEADTSADVKVSPTCEQDIADANAAAKITVPTLLHSSIPASINDTCAANFNSTYDTSVGRSFATWVAVAEPDPRETIAQFKQAAQLAKFDIVAEDYHNTEGSLVVSLKSQNGVQGFPFHIDVDRALGTISVSTRANPNQDAPIEATQQIICGMIAMATGSPLPESDTQKKSGGLRGLFGNRLKKTEGEREKVIQKHRQVEIEAFDMLYQRALESGKAIVLVPSINLDEKYRRDEAQERHAEFWADETSTTIWQGMDDHKNLFKVGQDASSERTGLHGYVHSFDAGRTLYLMYIVNPDTYTVTGNTVEAERTTLPDVNDTHKSSKPALGQTTFVQTKNTEFYQTQEWSDAIYANRTVNSDYCTLAIAGGPCVQWNTSSSTVQDKVSQEGYRTVTKSKLVDGLIVATKLTREFASFKIGPGEVVMVDGFFAQHPNIGFDAHACVQGNNAIQCDVRDYTLVRIPAKLSDLEGPDAQSAIQVIPNLANIYSKAKYRQTEVMASAGKFVDSWGREYILK